LCVVSFRCHRHTRPVHSFPTRRSSDLSKPPGFLLQGEANDVNNALQVQQGRIQDEVVQMRIVRVAMELPLQIAGSLMIFPVNARDRKSTRLNSSHDQISYAVFCLKKKT